jgi:hypothetical protein
MSQKTLARGSVERLELRMLLSGPDAVGVAGGNVPPEVAASRYTDTSQLFELTFSEDLGINIRNVALRLVDLETGQPVDPNLQTTISNLGRPSEVTWQVIPRRLPAGRYRATIPATSVVDQAGNRMARDFTFEFETQARVAARRVFYNNSAFDGRNPAPSASDADAIDYEKLALRPGQSGSPANVTNYTRGINGLLVEIAGLRPTATPGPAEFEFHVGGAAGSGWSAAPAPSATLLRRGAGNTAIGGDQYLVVWPDYSIRNTWLRVTAKATPQARLAPETFYFGNLVGETDDGTAVRAAVNGLDVARVRAAYNTIAQRGSRVDVNHDGRVNALDLLAVRANHYRTLPLLSAPPTAATDLGVTSSPAPRDESVAAGLLGA